MVREPASREEDGKGADSSSSLCNSRHLTKPPVCPRTARDIWHQAFPSPLCDTSSAALPSAYQREPRRIDLDVSAPKSRYAPLPLLQLEDPRRSKTSHVMNKSASSFAPSPLLSWLNSCPPLRSADGVGCSAVICRHTYHSPPACFLLAPPIRTGKPPGRVSEPQTPKGRRPALYKHQSAGVMIRPSRSRHGPRVAGQRIARERGEKTLTLGIYLGIQTIHHFSPPDP